MKKSFLINKFASLALAAAALTFGACSDDFLQVDSPNEPSGSTFWQTESDALMALTACYDALQSQNLYDDNIDGWRFGFLERETCTDNGYHSWGDWMLGTSISKGTSSTNDECFSMYWNANFEVIKRCNFLLDNIENVPIDAAIVGAYKAEAIALRALAYCNLTSVFRDVPYLTTSLTIDNPTAPKTMRAEIVESLLADLAENVPLIPVKGQAGKGRMTREAAYAIMGRIALFNQKWDTAISAYNQVIGKVQLFKSGDGTDYHKNFADLFTQANETADEVLLSVHYKSGRLGEGSCFGVCWSAPMNAIEASMNLCDEYYCIDGLSIYESPLFEGDPDHYDRWAEGAEKRFENRDPRLKGTLMVPGMLWNGKLYDGGSMPGLSSICIRKWYTPEDTANEYDGGLDYYIIRYSEVLVSLAEAMVEKGGYPQSDITKYINEVRARVGMPAVEDVEGTNLSQEQLRKIVRHERRVELAFEDLRFADLYRWGEWQNAMQRMTDDNTKHGFGFWYSFGFRGPQDTVWPIPQSEIDTNDLLEQHAEWK